MRRMNSERGVALVEAAVTIPLLLLIAVAIFEFGRAYQTWQILTNAAREGARVAVLAGVTDDAVEARVREYMRDGQLPEHASPAVNVNVQRNATMDVSAGGNSASQITVDYPFEFIVLQPVARLVSPGTRTGAPLTMRAAALMRNESP
jgi:Flp pilus assembly protein TadG